MKNTPLARTTELARGPGPDRKTRIKKRNPARAKKRYETQFGDKAAFVRSHNCCTCGAAGPNDSHHVRSRGAGGTSKDLVPLCRRCHQTLHTIGVETFQERNDIDLRAVAEKFETWFGEDPQPLAF